MIAAALFPRRAGNDPSRARNCQSTDCDGRMPGTKPTDNPPDKPQWQHRTGSRRDYRTRYRMGEPKAARDQPSCGGGSLVWGRESSRGQRTMIRQESRRIRWRARRTDTRRYGSRCSRFRSWRRCNSRERGWCSVTGQGLAAAARSAELWFYYAVMATLGSVLGGFVTYRLARKGGKESLA